MSLKGSHQTSNCHHNDVEQANLVNHEAWDRIMLLSDASFSIGGVGRGLKERLSNSRIRKLDQVF